MKKRLRQQLTLVAHDSILVTAVTPAGVPREGRWNPRNNDFIYCINGSDPLNHPDVDHDCDVVVTKIRSDKIKQVHQEMSWQVINPLKYL